MSIGNNIKKWREIRNMKQIELAELVGVSDKTVSSWEINRTEPKMGMVEKICKALNCKKTDIIGPEFDYQLFLQNEDDSEYYLHVETAKFAQEVFENDRVLFDVYRSADKDRLIEYANKLKALRDMEEGNI